APCRPRAVRGRPARGDARRSGPRHLRAARRLVRAGHGGVRGLRAAFQAPPRTLKASRRETSRRTSRAAIKATPRLTWLGSPHAKSHAVDRDVVLRVHLGRERTARL